MRLLFVNAHYYPDVASTGQHLTDLAEYLAAEGHDVSVLTGRARYLAGKVEALRREVVNGVDVSRISTTSFGRGSAVGRIIDYASFYLHALGRLLGSRDAVDGVILLTTPPLLSFLGLIVRRLRGRRYAVWSMDLHPDAEFAAGMLRRDSVAGRLLEWMNAAGCRGADFVVDLGAYMKRRLAAKGVSPDRLHTVHVWSRAEEIEPTPREANPLVAELGLGDRFVVMYSGNAGVVHEFGPLLEAMRRLREDPRLFFLFVGGGPQRPAIEAFAREHAIANFTYRDYFPRDRLRYSLAVADAHLVTLRAPFVGISVPGKLYGVMASGRPALFLGPERCESADAVRDAGCGAVVDASRPDAVERIVATLREWASDPAQARHLGASGRAAFLRQYERVENCRAFEEVLRAAWDSTFNAAESRARDSAVA